MGHPSLASFGDGRLRPVRGKGPALGSSDYRPELPVNLNLRMDTCSVLPHPTTCRLGPREKGMCPRKSLVHNLSKQWESVCPALVLGS